MTRPLLFDVTHTFGHPHNTGVQRVVRRLAVWARHWPQTTFIRFDRTVQDFLPLTHGDIDQLIDGWTEVPSGTKEPNQGLLRRLTRSLPGSQKFVDALRTWRTKRAFQHRPRQVDFRGAVYLSAEVFGDADRTTALRWWLDQGQTQVVLVVHDLIPYVHPEWSIFNLRHFRNYLAILGRATTLATVSRHTLDQVQSWFDDQHRPPPLLKVVRPGFDLPQAKTDGPPVRAGGLGVFFACVGTVEPRKNQFRVLTALKALWDEGRNFTFVFAGKEADGGDFRRAWEKMAGDYPVLWWNPATDDEVEWLYNHAWATVYPSLAEGFGLPVVESLARGTPCITAAGGATGETATDLGGCLTIDPTDAGAIQAALARLLDDAMLRPKLVADFRLNKMRLWKDFAGELQALVGELAETD